MACSFARDRYSAMPSAALGSLSIISDTFGGRDDSAGNRGVVFAQERGTVPERIEVLSQRLGDVDYDAFGAARSSIVTMSRALRIFTFRPVM
jgi:hypothetical protein